MVDIFVTKISNWSRNERLLDNTLSHCATNVHFPLCYELSPNSYQSQGIINDPHIINLGRYCRSYIREDDVSPAIITIVGLTDKRISSLVLSLTLSLPVTIRGSELLSAFKRELFQYLWQQEMRLLLAIYFNLCLC